MEINLPANEYSAVLHGMQHDLRNAILQNLYAPHANVIKPRPEDRNFVILEIEAPVVRVSIYMTIPYVTVRHNDCIVQDNNVTIMITVRRRKDVYGAWLRDVHFGDEGITIIKATSFDMEAVEKATQVVLNTIHPLFETELAAA